MDCTVQEINIHKQMLINLDNKLINTQIINEEISINNEIKKESECLNSLLNIKQNYLMNQFNQNNFNNLILQQNQVMFPPSPIIPVNKIFLIKNNHKCFERLILLIILEIFPIKIMMLEIIIIVFLEKQMVKFLH